MIDIDTGVLEILKQIQESINRIEEKQENMKNVVKQNCLDIAKVEAVIKGNK